MDRFFIPETPFNLDLSDHGNPTPGTVSCQSSGCMILELIASSPSAYGANGRVATNAGVSNSVRTMRNGSTPGILKLSVVAA